MATPEYDIAARQERYRQAHNSLDLEKFDACFSRDVDYSDHGLGVLNIDRAALKALAVEVFASVKDLVFETVSANGTKEFTAWEWAADGTLLKEIPGVPLKVGGSLKMTGCSLFWWDVDGEGPEMIKKLVEYSKIGQ